MTIPLLMPDFVELHVELGGDVRVDGDSKIYRLIELGLSVHGLFYLEFMIFSWFLRN